MKEYDHKKIEPKWQKHWNKEQPFRTTEDPEMKKCYVLDEFPYPSGEGLHMGHTRIYTASDVYARKKRMEGFNVLHPTGWDAFGLPAEQFAIKNKTHPSYSVAKNTKRYHEQMDRLAFSYDWSREINTTDPAFYRWTQWIFLRMFERGLAIESREPINWCPTCQTGLANEDLEGGVCERCGTPVEKRAMRQWVLLITKYADRLIDDLDALTDWPEAIKEAQRNWIGRSEGAEITFPLLGVPGQEDEKHKLTVFTTRADTLFGATFLAVSAELAKKWIDVGWKADPKIRSFIDRTIKQEAQRGFGEIPEKEGIFTGFYAKNPVNDERIPVWIANYILSGYGSGAIMAVPAHDKRDYDFAKKYDLPIRPVIYPRQGTHSHDDMKAVRELPEADLVKEANRFIAESGPYTGEGFLINSVQFNLTSSEEARQSITRYAKGEQKITYKLKDWVFSRQRYWGEPIPLVHDEDGTVYPVDDSDLPVTLPEVKSYAPTGTGESPLAVIPEWVNVEGYITDRGTFTMSNEEDAPADKKTRIFRRETNTMPQWAGSSWYYLRFMDANNKDVVLDPKKEQYWAPVDVYVGGAEHVTRHLIYARFWHKFLHDIGVVSTKEPFRRRRGVGLVLGEDGAKMSKRLGNIINPDEMIDRFGADALRVYVMFMGPFEQAIAWSTENVVGARRFIERLWRLMGKASKDVSASTETEILRHQSVKKVGEDIERFAFNTAISQLMILVNHLEKLETVPMAVYRDLILLAAPFAPHIAAELLELTGNELALSRERWPSYDPKKVVGEDMTIAIQVNGKLRDTLVVPRDTNEVALKATALERPIIKKWLDGKTPKKFIYVAGKILNIVVT